MGKLDDTLAAFRDASKKYPSALVAFSGGKDSLTVMDMAKRVFKEVQGFYMYFVPDLAFVNEQLSWAERYFGVTIHQVPHFLFYNCLKWGLYSTAPDKWDALPELNADDVYGYAMKETGIPLVVTGMKKSDFMFRRLNLGRHQRNVTVLHPIASWGRFDVLSYLKSHGIPIPKGTGALTNSVDLAPTNLLWLHDNHPKDFRKLCEFFPFAEAVVWRRTFYGISLKKEKAGDTIQDLKPSGWKT